MPLSLRKATLSTIIYADIFDYPLTLNEIHKWLIGIKSNKQILKIEIEKLKLIKEKSGFYLLRGREKIVDLRQKREKFSQDKLKIAKETVDLLKFIPSVKLVGITGALAVNNAKENDDIDLFIITSGGSLWTTRFFSTLLVEIMGKRRHPGESNVNNKICLNMYADENNLEISKNERDLFLAHEVLQMKPLFERENTYQRFLRVNSWARNYLPNTSKSNNKIQRKKYKEKNILANLVEGFIKRLQLWYMKNKRTTEVIREGVIRFHPNDARVWVMKKYKGRLDQYKLT